MKKKLLSMLLCAAILGTTLGVFAGCAPKDKRTTYMTIGVMTALTGVDDGSFNQNVYEGTLAFKAAIEAVNPTQEIVVKHNAITKVGAEWAGDLKSACETMANECDVVIGSGFQFAQLYTVAEQDKFKNKKFIIIDSPAQDANFAPQPRANLASFEFAENESGFLAGIAAALETKTGKVGFVGGLPYPSVQRYAWGFSSGVAYAKKQYDLSSVVVPTYNVDTPTADVNLKFTNDFANQEAGKTAGKALIDAGCDINFIAAGGAGIGSFSAAKEANKKVIGCDVDQFNLGENGGSNIVLTSALKRLNIAVRNCLEDIYYGFFVSGHRVQGAAQSGTGYVALPGRHQLSTESIRKIDEAFKNEIQNAPMSEDSYISYMANYGITIV